MTPGQRAYLDYMSWCLDAQRDVALGYEPTPEDAARFRREADEMEHRSHMESCCFDYGSGKYA